MLSFRRTRQHPLPDVTTASGADPEPDGRLEASSYCSGCAIATMVLELAPQEQELSAGFDQVFARWRTALVGRLQPWGVDPQRAVVLADLIMAVFEGTLILSRAARSSEPFWNTIETLITTAGCVLAEPHS